MYYGKQYLGSIDIWLGAFKDFLSCLMRHQPLPVHDR